MRGIVAGQVGCVAVTVTRSPPDHRPAAAPGTGTSAAAPTITHVSNAVRALPAGGPSLGRLDQTLRTALVARWSTSKLRSVVLHEMWLPRCNSRADVTKVHSAGLRGFEIKSEADTLKRLADQTAYYESVFAACTALVALRHLDAARSLLPCWWGLMTTTKDGQALRSVRRAQAHGQVDAEVIVQLLWKQEAVQALTALGHTFKEKSSRQTLWDELLSQVDTPSLQRIVAKKLADRDPTTARFGSPATG